MKKSDSSNPKSSSQLESGEIGSEKPKPLSLHLDSEIVREQEKEIRSQIIKAFEVPPNAFMKLDVIGVKGEIRNGYSHPLKVTIERVKVSNADSIQISDKSSERADNKG
jgi:hypothetical protein